MPGDGYQYVYYRDREYLREELRQDKLSYPEVPEHECIVGLGEPVEQDHIGACHEEIVPESDRRHIGQLPVAEE